MYTFWSELSDVVTHIENIKHSMLCVTGVY